MKKQKIVTVAALITLSNSALAIPVFDAANLAETVKLITAVREQIQLVKDSINQFKEYQQQFEKLKTIQEIAERTSEKIRDGNLDGALRGIERTIGYSKGYLAKITDIADINNIIADIDSKLISDELSSLKKQYLEDKKARLESEKTLISLKKSTNKNIEKMSKEESINQSHRINATNTSILARLAIENQHDRNSEKASMEKGYLETEATLLEAGGMFEKLADSEKRSF